MPMTLMDPLEARKVKMTKMALDILSSKCKTKVTTQTWIWGCQWGDQWIIMVWCTEINSTRCQMEDSSKVCTRISLCHRVDSDLALKWMLLVKVSFKWGSNLKCKVNLWIWVLLWMPVVSLHQKRQKLKRAKQTLSKLLASKWNLYKSKNSFQLDK